MHARCWHLPVRRSRRWRIITVGLLAEQTQLGLDGFVRLDVDRQHILAVLEHCVGREYWQAAENLAFGVTNYLNTHGFIVEWVSSLNRGLTAARALGNRHNEGAFLGNLGIAYRDLGQVEQAIDYYQQALAIAARLVTGRVKAADLGNLGTPTATWGRSSRLSTTHSRRWRSTARLATGRAKAVRQPGHRLPRPGASGAGDRLLSTGAGDRPRDRPPAGRRQP